MTSTLQRTVANSDNSFVSIETISEKAPKVNLYIFNCVRISFFLSQDQVANTAWWSGVWVNPVCIVLYRWVLSGILGPFLGSIWRDFGGN